ncbi:Biotin/lipoyl attachment [Macleaya cordata]|uniref:Biotin/lipoyl attachment n=1 Tax=Macleaya cordata TaxID=56857 RepID=A0A200PQI2_MACCD|nr:Biotin/lipoyl attachment [Macleaya cordata]
MISTQRGKSKKSIGIERFFLNPVWIISVPSIPPDFHGCMSGYRDKDQVIVAPYSYQSYMVLISISFRTNQGLGTGFYFICKKGVCNLGGASTIKFSNFFSDFTRTKSCSLHPLYGIRTSIRQKPLHIAGLVLSRVPAKLFTLSCGPSSETETATNLEDGPEEKKSTGVKSQIIPNSFEVQSLLTEICDTTSIAEFELKLGGFRLYVTRNLAGKSQPLPPPSSGPVSTNTSVNTSDLNGSVSTPTLAISKPVPSLGENQSLLDKATDEGLVILRSPKVGYFRRSRTIKGKRAPPSCKEKQEVKEGQVVCYIEQLGGEIPVECDVSGEVVKIIREDGDPVGYGDTLITILPSFPGIKKLQ